MTSLDTNVLGRLVSDKHACLSQLYELGRRQLDLIDDDDMSQLLQLLSDKQRSIAALAQIERELDPFRGERPEQRRWASEGERQRCASQLTQCDALLASILEQERHSEARLSVRRDEAAARLQGAHVAFAARGAYAESPRPLSTLDLSSER